MLRRLELAAALFFNLFVTSVMNWFLKSYGDILFSISAFLFVIYLLEVYAFSFYLLARCGIWEEFKSVLERERVTRST